MENLNRFFIFLSLFFVIAVLISACAAKTETAPKETGKTGTAATEPSKVSAEDSKGVLSGIFKTRTKTFMVAYDVKGQTTELSKMTMYFKNENMRYDTTADSKQNSLFFIDKKIYSCSSDPKMCVALGQQNETPKTGTEDVEKNLESYTIVAKPSRVIAGVTAKCFAVASSQVDSEACYSAEGVPLYTKSVAGGQTVEMTATAYSTSVSDSVFTLPAEPQDLSALAAKYQQ